MEYRNDFYEWLMAAAHIFFPVSCPVCGRLGSVGCGECLAALVRDNPPFCMTCGGGYPCGKHTGAPWVVCGATYDGVVRRAVHACKYGGYGAMCGAMGKALGDVYGGMDEVCLVPVPLHKGSARGYNQSLLMAGGIARTWGAPVMDCLYWAVARERQAVGKDRKIDASCLRWRGEPPEMPVVLVDDVFTTGNTIRACAASVPGAVLGAVVWARAL